MKKSQFRLKSVLLAQCPSCQASGIFKKGLAIRPQCLRCGYDFYPEPGFYVGAVMVGFLITAISTIPPLIILKVLDVSLEVLLVFPFIEFIFVGGFLAIYSRVIWLHLEYQMTQRLSEKIHEDKR